MNNHDTKAISVLGTATLPPAQGASASTLSHKAMEVIARTPDVRSDRVDVLKELVAQGSYQCNVQQVAVRLIADQCLHCALIPGRAANRTGRPVAGRKSSDRGRRGR